MLLNLLDSARLRAPREVIALGLRDDPTALLGLFLAAVQELL